MIYNPAAGGMRWRRGLPGQVAGALIAEGHGVAVVPTEGPGTAGRIARERIEAGADLILALGGDGTLNELLPGIVHTDVPVGVIPAGTANVLARELGLGCNALGAAKRLSECVPQRVPTGLLRSEADTQGRHFLLMAGVGFDAHVVYQLNLSLKAKMGQLAYWTSSFKQLFRTLDELVVEANGESFRCTFALATRVRNYAGYLQIARRVSLLKPEFELVLFEGTSTLRHYSKYVLAALSGKASNVKGMSFLRTREVTFSRSSGAPIHVQVDGEYAGRLPATVEIVPDALTLLVPPDYLKRT
jgi:diacylglycerol kinase (ATP)